MRTFSREHWNAALEAWAAGDFSDEWRPYRHQAALRGMIYPPEGSKWDSWEDAEPSQRAMLVRAIRDTPALLSQAIAFSVSWSGVIEYVLSRRDEWRAELAERERDRKADDDDHPTHREAMTRVSDLLGMIADSRP